MTLIARRLSVGFSARGLHLVVGGRIRRARGMQPSTGPSQDILRCPDGLTIIVEKGARYSLADRNGDGKVDAARLKARRCCSTCPGRTSLPASMSSPRRPSLRCAAPNGRSTSSAARPRCSSSGARSACAARRAGLPSSRLRPRRRCRGGRRRADGQALAGQARGGPDGPPRSMNGDVAGAADTCSDLARGALGRWAWRHASARRHVVSRAASKRR